MRRANRRSVLAVVATLCLAHAADSGPHLRNYWPLHKGEVVSYRVRKADEPAVLYRMTMQVEDEAEFGAGYVYTMIVVDGSDPKPRRTRLDVFVGDDQISDMGGGALLRTPLTVGNSWSSPVYSGKRVVGQVETAIIQVGSCGSEAHAGEQRCVITREHNSRTGKTVVRAFAAGRGLVRIEEYPSASAYRRRRAQRTEWLIGFRLSAPPRLGSNWRSAEGSASSIGPSPRLRLDWLSASAVLGAKLRSGDFGFVQRIEGRLWCSGDGPQF